MAENFFDQFDPPKSEKAGNFFDQFDKPAEPSRSAMDVVKDVGVTALKGAIGVPEAVVGLADIATGGRAGKALEEVGFEPKRARDIANDWYSEPTKAAQRKFQEADGIVDKAVTAVENPSLIATAVGESLPAMGAGGVAARGLMTATRLGAMGARGAALAGAAGEGVTAAGTQAEQIRQETPDGLLNPAQTGAAVATGAATGAFGALGGRIAQRLGIGDAETMLAQGAKDAFTRQAIATEAKSLPRQMVEGAISEGLLEELPQSVSEQVLQNLALGKQWTDGLADNVVMGVLAGATMGAGAAGVHRVGARESAAPAADPAEGRAASEPSDGLSLVPTDAAAPAAAAAEGDVLPPADSSAVQRTFDARDPASQPPLQTLPAAPTDGVPFVETAVPGREIDTGNLRLEEQGPFLALPAPTIDVDAAGTARTAADRNAARELPSQRMGLDPNAGTLSAAAVQAVDGGAHADLLARQAAAAAQAQADELEKAAAKGKKPPATKAPAPAPAAASSARGLDAETGELFDAAQDRATELQGRLSFVRQQAAANGWDARLVAERDRAQAELAALTPAPAPPPAIPATPPANLREGIARARQRRAPAVAAPPVEKIPSGPQAASVIGQQQDSGAAVEKIPQAAGEQVAAAANEAATSPQNKRPEPTQAQKEAGNYKLGHLSGPDVQGLRISIENPQGSTRSGTSPDGRQWSNTMAAHYGYVKGGLAADGDHVDVFVGPHAATAPMVYVVDQVNPDGSYDEAKALFGFNTEADAVAAYKGSYDANWKVGPVTAISVDDFKAGLASGRFKKPLSDQLKKPKKQPPAPAERASGATESVAQTADKPDGSKIEDFGEKIGGARKDRAEKTGQRPAAPAPKDDRPTWARRLQVSQIAKSSTPGEEGRWVIRDARSLDWRKQPRQVGRDTYATREEAEAAVPLAAVSLKHRAIPTGGGKYEIWRDVTDRKRVKVVDRTFDTRDEALRYMAEHAQQIVETNTTFGEADLPRPQDQRREGDQRRTGEVKDGDFIDTFGFRGVEFGNWNNQADRQQLLNDAFDGLLDLADVLGVPPRALSLNGELALAFGARGQGLSGARAHYEPAKAVINLTKLNGAGSLAHEWFHAMDHYFGRQDGKASAEWVTEKDGTRSLKASASFEEDAASGGLRGERSGVRAEVREAYADLMRTIAKKAEGYVEDTARADQFVARARSEVQQSLASVRSGLAQELDARYYKRHNKPASTEQLAEFDTVAQQILDGVALDLRLGSKAGSAGRLAGMRWTNDALEKISAIMKAVRGRQGFSADNNGPLDRLRSAMQLYSARLKMLADAQQGSEKTRMVPTQFAMDAKELDQGRGQDYWTTPHEMAARAFQGYVEDKIAAQGGRSPFLNFGPENAGILTPWGVKRPFPHGVERAAINRAMERLVQTIQTREGEGGNVAMFRRGEAPAFSPAAIAQAVQAVTRTSDRIRSAWASGPEVVVAFDMNDPVIPEAVRRADQKQRSGGAAGDPEGFYYRGKAYLIASQLHSENDVARVLFHEVLGHHGLRSTFGPGLGNILNQIATMRRAEVDAKAAEYGLRGVTAMDRRIAAEEVLAEMAQNTPDLHFVRRAIAAIRTWLRENVPGFRNMRMSDDEIVRNFILPARAYVERGLAQTTSTALPAPAFARAAGYDEAVDAAVADGMAGKAPGRGPVAIGDTSAALQAAGLPAGELRTSPAVLAKVVFDHGVPKSMLKRIPELLESPVMVFASDSVAGRYVAVTSEMVRGQPLVVAISPEETRGARTFNFVPSLYPKDDLRAIQRWLNDGKLRYLDKEQSPQWLGSTRLQLPGEYRSAKGLQSSSVATDGGARNAPAPSAEPSDETDMGPEPRFSRSTVKNFAQRATAELNKTFSAPGKLSWWHKTVGTMYNLAERSPAFKGVFDAAQGFVDDVSFYASDAAELAPRLLPKLETWRDIKKSPVAAADNKAIAKPVFEGTLTWARDEQGKVVPVQSLIDAAAGYTTEQKAQRLLRNGQIDERMLRAWQGMPLESYEKAINSRYESRMLQPGVVWSDDELRSQFNLTPEQISLYREFRASTDRSLDTMARADMLRFAGDDAKGLREIVMDAPDVQEAALLLRDHLVQMASDNPDRATMLLNTANGIIERADKVRDLQGRGYAPLSRFGRYTVDVVDANGDRQYFSTFETAREANAMAGRMREEFGAEAVSQGTMSDEAFKLFAGVTPETLELFGNALGLDSTGSNAQDQAFQEYLKLTKTNRSAMRRLIHRKGIAGFSEDVGRVLAAFVYSNARQTAAGLHMGDLGEAVNAIPKEQGQLKDAAVRLAEYVKNPQEEAQAVRGLLFAQYLGGSIASALVNALQPVQVTFPWLSQYGGAKAAAAQMGRAAKDVASRGKGLEPELAAALKRAEAEGVVAPQEVHQLMAQARGAGSLRSGDGTRIGDLRAMGQNALSRLSLAWGKVFGAAEQLNRRITFIAAYRTAKEQGMADPPEFARKAITETQFLYSKANKMEWGRGAVGGTLMTFKTYSVAYLELLHRMYTQGGPEGKRATLLALSMLMLMGGAGGLPFEEDLEDAADGLAQMLGYNFSTKKARQELLESVMPKGLAAFIDKGISGLPGAPLDVSGRLGMGNLIPGTGLLQEKTSHARDILEIAGPAGDFASRILSGGKNLLTGNVGAGLLEISPAAVRNAAKGADMAATGMYRDAKGYKVLDTNLLEAALKSIGFQPASVSNIQETNSNNQTAKAFYNMRAQEIRAEWAQGIFENDPGKVQKARDAVADWNAKNPEQPMVIKIPDVMRRVKEMRKSKDERIADTAPKAMRAQMREDIARTRAALAE